MAAFNEVSNKGRQRVRVCGRGMFCTNSILVEFVSEYGTEAFPIGGQQWDSGVILSQDNVWSFAYEVDGHFLIDATAKFNNLNTGPYEKHFLPPNNTLTPTPLFKPFEFKIDLPYPLYGVGSPQKFAILNLAVLNQNNQAVITQYLANKPYTYAEIMATFPQGSVVKDSYSGWSPTNPQYQWPSTIETTKEILPSLDAPGNTVYGGCLISVVQPNGSTKPVTFLCSPPRLNVSGFQRYAPYLGPTGYPGYTVQ